MKESYAQKVFPTPKDKLFNFKWFPEAIDFAKKQSKEGHVEGEKYCRWYAFDPNQKVTVIFTNGRPVKLEVL